MKLYICIYGNRIKLNKCCECYEAQSHTFGNECVLLKKGSAVHDYSIALTQLCNNCYYTFY